MCLRYQYGMSGTQSQGKVKAEYEAHTYEELIEEMNRN
jgi:hypothetical protein